MIYDAGKIIPGLVVFVLLATFPLWWNLGQAQAVPQPELPKDQKFCVAPKEEMRTGHMQTLNAWRDTVVREGMRLHVADNGQEFNMSLSNECLRCHANREKFCDRCHNYLGVVPYCWDCHLSDQYGKGKGGN